MNFEDDDSDKKPKTGMPHRDLADNVAFFHRQMSFVNWLPNERDCPVSYEVYYKSTDYVYNPHDQRHEGTVQIKEYKCVIFMFPKGCEKTTTVISFHQSTRKSQNDRGFKEELCWLLNYFGAHGWLEHKRTNSVYAKPKQEKWNNLFGN
jgi:hypothetical protein